MSSEPTGELVPDQDGLPSAGLSSVVPSELPSQESSTQPSTLPTSNSLPSDRPTDSPTRKPRAGGGGIFAKRTAAPSPPTADEEPSAIPSSREPLETKPPPTSQKPAESSAAPYFVDTEPPTDIPRDGSTLGPSVVVHDESLPPTRPTQGTGEMTLNAESKEVQPDGTITAAETTGDEDEEDDDENSILRKWEKVAIKTTWFEYFL